jgi:phosphoribosyl 1,2-cyclic phosphate phosphodiesterase
MEQAVDLLEELQPKQGYLIHISHLMGLHNEVVKELPDFIKPAHDGLVLQL